MPDPDRLTGSLPHVTAVLVAHDGALWLPQVLAALAAQTRPPDLVVGVDTASTDDSAKLLADALGEQALVSVSVSTGFGAALAAGLAAAEVSEPAQSEGWIWLLHDDSAPDPDALAQLLEAAAAGPEATVLGPKLVDWSNPRQLLEVGLAIDAVGQRETGLEPGELDQGQHDWPRDVLAVSTAGALIRRDGWAGLGGLDPLLPLLQEDIDFCIRVRLAGARVRCVPAARVRHVAALRRGVRSPGALPGYRRAVDREHALRVLLANAGPIGGLLGVGRLLLGQLARVVGYLLTRRAAEAGTELVALARLLAAPGRLAAARRWRRRHRWSAPGPARRLWDLRRLRVTRRQRLRVTLAVVGERWTRAGSGPPPSTVPSTLDGPAEYADLPADDGVLRRVFTAPGVLLTGALALVAVVAGRHLVGAGPLAGGRLLPAPGATGELWTSWAASWHEAGLGSAAPAAPWTPLLALLGTLTGGRPALAVTLLLLLALPLAGATAYRATRWLAVGSPGAVAARLVAAASYPLLSGLPAAVGAGRFDTVVAVVALPALLTAGCRVLHSDPALAGWRRSWALGLGLTVTLAVAPQLWLPALVLLLTGSAAVLATGRLDPAAARRRATAAGLALLVPLLLLGPFTLHAVAHPAVLLTGLGGPGGIAGLAGHPVGPVGLLLLRPAPSAPVPEWLVAPLLLAALLGLARERRVVALAGIGIAVVGWATALADSRTPVLPGYGWPGTGLALTAAGLLVAAMIAGDGARAALARHSFSGRQPLAGLLAASAALAPVLAAGLLSGTGFNGPVHRYGANPLPAFVLEDVQFDPGQRLLVLTASRRQVRYRLGAATGPLLGDEDQPVSPAGRRLLHAVVVDLAAPVGSDAAAALATFHVRYVAVPPPVSRSLAAALDRQPGLTRLTAPGGTGLWRLTVRSSRLQLLTGGAARAADQPGLPTVGSFPASAGTALPAGRVGSRAVLGPGGPGRLVVLSEAADPGWQATLGGHRLTPVRAWGWAQAFKVPATGRPLPLVVAHPDGRLLAWHVVQGLFLLVVVVLAAPAVRRREDVVPPVPPVSPLAPASTLVTA